MSLEWNGALLGVKSDLESVLGNVLSNGHISGLETGIGSLVSATEDLAVEISLNVGVLLDSSLVSLDMFVIAKDFLDVCHNLETVGSDVLNQGSVLNHQKFVLSLILTDSNLMQEIGFSLPILNSLLVDS